MTNHSNINQNLKVYDLQKVGLNISIKIIGSLEILLSGTGVPIVFLIDEEHHNDFCTNSNVLNANELINKADVQIIGVESHSGGKIYDIYEEKYITKYDYGKNSNPVNDYPKFAKEIMKYFPQIIFGVECEGMLDKIHCDLTVNDNQYYGKPIPQHPLNISRSEHFIRTLFELRLHHNIDGNLILNVGGNHNTDIENWIKNGSIESLVNQKACYVRLRAPEYKAHSL